MTGSQENMAQYWAAMHELHGDIIPCSSTHDGSTFCMQRLALFTVPHPVALMAMSTPVYAETMHHLQSSKPKKGNVQLQSGPEQVNKPHMLHTAALSMYKKTHTSAQASQSAQRKTHVQSSNCDIPQGSHGLPRQQAALTHDAILCPGLLCRAQQLQYSINHHM